jgi:hypothetical protein
LSLTQDLGKRGHFAKVSDKGLQIYQLKHIRTGAKLHSIYDPSIIVCLSGFIAMEVGLFDNLYS